MMIAAVVQRCYEHIDSIASCITSPMAAQVIASSQACSMPRVNAITYIMARDGPYDDHDVQVLHVVSTIDLSLKDIPF